MPVGAGEGVAVAGRVGLGDGVLPGDEDGPGDGVLSGDEDGPGDGVVPGDEDGPGEAAGVTEAMRDTSTPRPSLPVPIARTLSPTKSGPSTPVFDERMIRTGGPPDVTSKKPLTAGAEIVPASERRGGGACQNAR